jgi:hypothetical protein
LADLYPAIRARSIAEQECSEEVIAAAVLRGPARAACRGDSSGHGRGPADERELWSEFARLNPGFDEYRNLTERQIPVVLLERRSAA